MRRCPRSLLPRLSAGCVVLFALSACRADPADLVWTGARIYTQDTELPTASALAIRDGRVLWVGDESEARHYMGRDTTAEDLGGKTVLPGFIDAHTHLIWSGTELLDVDLYEATVVQDLLDAISARAEDSPDDPWVRGGGWDSSIFEGALNKALLDGVVADRPVYMSSADAHSAWVNSAALAEAGITSDTPDPPAGEIVRDEHGEATGILRESAIDLITLPDYTEDQIDAGFELAQAEASASGITTIIDACAEDWMLAGYRRAEAAGDLNLRVFAAWPDDPARGPEQVDDLLAAKASDDSDRVQITQVKFYLDGVVETGTAYMLQPYTDGSNGEATYTDAALLTQALAYDEAGVQLHAHAVGDGAVRQMLDTVEQVSQINGPGDRRALLAHIEVIDPEDAPRFGTLEVMADFQALWAYPDSYITDLTWPIIGEARSEELYPIHDVLAGGGALAFGSDWSVSSMYPLDAIEVAVTRQDPYEDGGLQLLPDQAITAENAVAATTTGSALATRHEDEIGRIKVGWRADLVVLDGDPMSVDSYAISDILVLRTLIDGQVVYRAPPDLTSLMRRPRHLDR